MDHEHEPTRWTIHGERVVDDTRRLRLSIASVELPDGVQFEQYVLRMPKAAMMIVLDDDDRVLMMWRHRFIIDRWVWELPGGYVNPNEDPAVTAAREVEEETGWRPQNVEQLAFGNSTDRRDCGRREPGLFGTWCRVYRRARGY